MTSAHHGLVALAAFLACLGPAMGQTVSTNNDDVYFPDEETNTVTMGTNNLGTNAIPTDTNEVYIVTNGVTIDTNVPAQIWQQVPAQNLHLMATNQIQPQMIQPVIPVFGNPAVNQVFAPTVPGSGQLGSPLLGTSAFGGGGSAIYGAVPIGSSSFNGMGPSGGLVWGNLAIEPSVSYSISEATDLGATPGQRTDVAAESLSVNFGVTLGPHWSLGYGVGYSWFNQASFGSSASQSLNLAGDWTWKDWSLSVSQGYSTGLSLLVETASQTSEAGYGTSLSASHPITGNLSLSTGLNQSIRTAEGFADSYSWGASAGLAYTFTPWLSSGVNFNGGYSIASGTPSILTESASGDVVFRPGQKASLVVSVGVADQQFSAGGVPPPITPIWSASLGYALSQATTLSLSGSRNVGPSFYGNEDVVSSELALSLSHTFSRKWSSSLSVSYGNSSYTQILPGPLPSPYYFGFGTGTVTPLTVVRSDTTEALSLGINYAISRRWNASAGYSLVQNVSSQSDFAFSSAQVSASISYSY